MNNRPPSAPLLLVAAFSFVISPPFLALAEPGVPADASSSNAAPAPAAPVTSAAPAPTTPTAPAPAASSSGTTTASSSSYTVVSGDSLWLIAHKSGCTVAGLEKANHIKKSTLLHPGQVLKIPPPKTPKSTTTPTPATKPDAAAPTPKHHKMYAKAQPVQDFDIPASTFASCPVPLASPDEDTPATANSAPDTPETSAPIAKLVSPSEMPSDSSVEIETATSVTPAPVTDVAAPTPIAHHSAETVQDDSASVANSEPVVAAPVPKPAGHGFNFNPFSIFSKPSTDWASRFLQQARSLADMGIEYDEDWRPPGESHSWAMDCSNTSRYLYKVTAGIQLPRTASDQYFYLHLQNKAWDVPQAVNGYADCNYLRENLKPGDLLFWENTYRPERQPPITHVMVFLGNNEKGEWIMAGSQTSRGGEHNRRNGGPDIYVFDPTKPCGGYTTWLGLVHHYGRFCAYGRPLEADPAKLAVAAND